MKKTHKILGILIIISVFVLLSSSKMSIQAVDNGTSLNASDSSAPEITFNITDFQSSGLMTGKICEDKSTITNYTISHLAENDTYSNSDLIAYKGWNSTYCNVTIVDAQHIEFVISDDMFKNECHNWIIIEPINDKFISTMPTIKQGGGGGGGFGFCDDQDCWGPMPMLPVKLQNSHSSVVSQSIVEDPNAPIILFDLMELCCKIPSPLDSPNIYLEVDSVTQIRVGDGWLSEAFDTSTGFTYRVHLVWGESEIPAELAIYKTLTIIFSAVSAGLIVMVIGYETIWPDKKPMAKLVSVTLVKPSQFVRDKIKKKDSTKK